MSKKYDIYDSGGNYIGTAQERDDWGPDRDYSLTPEERNKQRRASRRDDAGANFLMFVFLLIISVVLFLILKKSLQNEANTILFLFIFGIPFLGVAGVTIKTFFEMIGNFFDL